jgi:NitT/TauT family transport system substrate-binding protein
MNRRLRLLVAAVSGLILIAAACGDGDTTASGNGEDGAGELTPLRFVAAAAVPIPTEQVAVWAVAKELGYFEDEGLDVTMDFADGSTAAIQAVAGGSGDVTIAEQGSILAAVEEGVPIKSYATLVEDWQWYIGVPPDSDIQSGADLEGRRIGIISLASGSYIYAQAYVNEAGLDAASDVEYVPVGVGPTAAAALRRGEVDALALYTTAYTELELAGEEVRLLENPPLFDGLVGISFAAPSDSIEDNREALVGFARAGFRAVTFTAENPEAAMRIGYEHIPGFLADQTEEERIEADTAALQTEVSDYTPDGNPEDWETHVWGEATEDELQATVDYLLAAEVVSSELPPGEWWDSSLLEDINEFDRNEPIETARTYSG